MNRRSERWAWQRAMTLSDGVEHHRELARAAWLEAIRAKLAGDRRGYQRALERARIHEVTAAAIDVSLGA